MKFQVLSTTRINAAFLIIKATIVKNQLHVLAEFRHGSVQMLSNLGLNR